MLVEKKYKEGDVVTLVMPSMPETLGVFVSEDETTITLNCPAHIIPNPPSDGNPEGGYNFIPFSVTGKSNSDIIINKSTIISSMKTWQGHADNYKEVIKQAIEEFDELEKSEQED